MKKIQKQYERKLKVNHNNDVFTTFQRNSRQQSSIHLPKKNKQPSQPHIQGSIPTQHQNIQSLKNTLKSLVPVSMEITKQFSKVGHYSISQDQQQSEQNYQYNHKLNRLIKNLEQIGNKNHFNPHPNNNTKQLLANRQKKSKTTHEKSQTISRYQPISTQQFIRYPSNNTSLQLPIQRNHSFLQKQRIKSHSKSIKKHQSSLKQIRNHYQDMGGRESSKNRKKSSTKKDIIQGVLQKGNSKNLVKIFQSLENTQTIKPRQKHQPQRKYQTIFKQKIHRHKITHILISNHIYTSSLDHTVKKLHQKQGNYQSDIVQNARGPVQCVSSINSHIFTCSRDHYLRSLDGDFFYKWDSIPLSCSESQKINQANISFSNHELKLFDIEKRNVVCSLQFDMKFSLMSKINKEIYIGKGGALFGVDWRKKQFLVNLYRERKQEECHWISDPYSKSIICESQGQLTIFGNDFKKIRTKSIPVSYSYQAHFWGRSCLNILVNTEDGRQKVVRYDEHRDWQEVDCLSDGPVVNKFIVRDRQLFYACKEGTLIVKQYLK